MTGEQKKEVYDCKNNTWHYHMLRLHAEDRQSKPFLLNGYGNGQ